MVVTRDFAPLAIPIKRDVGSLPPFQFPHAMPKTAASGTGGLPMILYPAIDLKDGQCVRLLRGEMNATPPPRR
jgi:hypothetical protein